MGLDAVEIVMAVEDVFDIQIEDAEAEKVLTPAQLIDLVMGKVATATTDVCLTHRSFNLLRGFFVRRCAFERKQVRPEMELSTAFPPTERKARLQLLSTELSIESLPQLVRPGWLTAMLATITFAAGLTAAVWSSHLNLPLWVTVPLAIGVTAYAAATVTRHLRTEFPKSLPTVAGLATWIMCHKPDLATAGKPAWTRDQVAARVREIVVGTLGCGSKYREGARFIQDLGMD